MGLGNQDSCPWRQYKTTLDYGVLVAIANELGSPCCTIGQRRVVHISIPCLTQATTTYRVFAMLLEGGCKRTAESGLIQSYSGSSGIRSKLKFEKKSDSCASSAIAEPWQIGHVPILSFAVGSDRPSWYSPSHCCN
jgi:hypothetical protein